MIQLTETQKQSVQDIVDACTKYGVTDKRMMAYILATAYWETGRTMLPIEEYGRGAGHKYGHKIKQSGEPYETPDHIYYGRGFCQTSWYENYQMLSDQAYAKQQGWDFLNHPELLLLMEPSVWAMIHCMYHGLYTGVGLPKYFNDTVTDPVNARKIINGLDKADMIAGFYAEFIDLLS